MAQAHELFDITKNHLVGKMVFTDRGGVKIESIDVPEAKEIFIVSEEDLSNPLIDMFGDSVPVFAHGFSEYNGQPLFAVLGRDWESVDLYISKVKVNYSEKVDSDYEEIVEQKMWSGGKEIKFNESDDQNHVVRSSFIVKNHYSALLGDQRILADYSDGNIYIKLASQWPLHVRDSIASGLGLSRKAVEVYPVQFQTVYDELVFGPEVAGVVASAAAKKFEGLVEFSMPMISNQGMLSFDIQTLLGESDGPVAQIADVKVDLGASPVLSSEYVNSIVAGINPPYGLSYAQTTVTVTKSHHRPAGIFSDTGYAMALAASENHYTKVVASLGRKQTEWRSGHIEMTPIKKGLYSSSQFTSISRMLDDCAKVSWFDRQYAVNSQKGLANNRVNPFVKYSRGIGIACGQGVQGFSNKFSYLKHYSISGTYYKDGKIKIACGIPVNADYEDTWKEILVRQLGVEEKSIVFENLNNSTTDIGPDTLSRGLRTVPFMLEKLSGQIKEKLESPDVEFPISCNVSLDSSGKKDLFCSDSFGTIVVALHIDSIMLVPVIENVWARLQFGKVIDRVKLGNKMRQQISHTISELCPSAQNVNEIDLFISEEPEKPIASGVSLVRGLTAAALTSALSQALGHTVTKLPVQEEDVLGIINKQYKKNTQEETKQNEN